MADIRPYRETDKYNVQRICLQTVNDESVFEGLDRFNADFLLPVYNDYYTEQEPENCFVCTDENDTAVGYVICSEDVKKWRRIFMKEYFPRIRHKHLGNRTTAIAEIAAHSLFARKYPAHLHIDILKEYRGGGTGTKLIETLADHLAKKGICGIQLCVGNENKKAIRFYKRCGFKTLANFGTGRAMGLKIKSK